MKRAALLLVIVTVLYVATSVEAEKDLYKILGVPRNVDEKTLKKTFRKLSLQYHPDKNPGNDEAQRKYQEITEAYDVLSDAEKRRAYDRSGMDGVQQHTARQQQGGGGGNPFGDMMFDFGGFKVHFGGQGGMQEQEKRGPDSRVSLELTLEEIYNGKVLEALYRKQTVCHSCKRSKTTVSEEEILIDVERGVPNGHEIVFENGGDEIPDGVAGNLIFTVQSTTHETFTRDGNNLKMTKHISLLEALTGYNFKVKHLDGRSVTIDSKGVTTPFLVRRISGEGMPIYGRPGSFGDLFIELVIDFPTKISPEQGRLLRDALG
uniref:J domain-containing protein n=1 Tax=Palpitomonas bilix TaxID=652834 RepID=A0A7S3D4B2_9EUKA|mmetsp:Transcript_20548/g.52785  ORF Transcript_20548/g.52785 Transcript_20548/m.52785 type:complete len:319 (+) Transcript_20548:60-1016(+)